VAADALLSVREVAERLGVRRAGVLALIRAGELRAVDVALRRGGRPLWRIDPDDLEAFVARRTRPAAPRRRRRRTKKLPPVKAYF
jgi:excisionase family DNA binding protein